MSRADEETGIQLTMERAGLNTKNVIESNRPNLSYLQMQMTSTGLRLPKGLKPDIYETDANGRKFWRRIVLVDSDEKEEILVPAMGVVIEWDEKYGIPKITSDKELGYVGEMYGYRIPKYEDHTTHFWFDPEEADDLAIQLDGDRYTARHKDSCLSIYAEHKRSHRENFIFRQIKLD